MGTQKHDHISKITERLVAHCDMTCKPTFRRQVIPRLERHGREAVDGLVFIAHAVEVDVLGNAPEILHM